MNIELVPEFDRFSVKNRLEANLSRCLSVKGCVAFWTIDVKFFRDSVFAKALMRNGSFYCIDIESPTNIDRLAEYVDYGVEEIYLHSYRLAPIIRTKTTNLLHSKIILFEFENEEVEIWVGSHNMTNYALKGTNIEASTIIKCKMSDAIYRQTLSYLETIRDIFCRQFQMSEIDIYKRLQTRDAQRDIIIQGEVAVVGDVIMLVGEGMESLEKEDVIQLLSRNNKSYSRFKVVESRVCLHSIDIKSFKETLYICQIAQSGMIDGASPKLEIDFMAPRRFAYIGITQLAHLKPSIKVDKILLEQAKYFVNLTILHKSAHFKIYEKPTVAEMSLWQDDYQSPYGYIGSKGVIQKATYGKESDIDLRTVSLVEHWMKYREAYKLFYKDLDCVIEEENQIMKNIKDISLDSNLNDFLELNIEPLKELSANKPYIERLILENWVNKER